MRLILSLVLCWTALAARAEVDWRISVKLIADRDGVVPPTWASRILADLNLANQVMHRSGRGYGFDLVELVVLTGVSQWNWTQVTDRNRDELHAAARAQPALYGYRTDALNVYVVANVCHGSCQLGDAGGDIILMSGDSLNTPLLHLSGHFFNLKHTHEGQRFLNPDGSDCGTSCDFCERQLPGEADGTIETAPDNQCFQTSDVIARAAYNLPFVDLDAVRQERVENTRFNIMSFHDDPDRLTSDQLDFMISDSNTRRRSIATGITWFVSRDGNDGGSGVTSNSRFQTVGRALSVAGHRDTVLFRAGTYTAPTTINQPVEFRGSRGDVTLVRP